MDHPLLWKRLKNRLRLPILKKIERRLMMKIGRLINGLMEIRSVEEMLHSPVSRADVISAYKILGLHGYNLTRLENVLREHRRIQWQPLGVFLNLIELPEIADLLNIELQKAVTPPIPIRLSFGATVFGFTWDYFVSDFVRRNGYWEKDVQSIISGHLKPGDVAVDIGANIGCHTALMAHIVGPKGRVHSVEPVEYLFRSLTEMVAFNKFEQVTLHKIAMSNKTGSANIRLATSNPGGNSLTQEPFATLSRPSEPPGVEQVVSRTMDEYLLPVCDRCDFIKIDVEGHEGAVLEGSREFIRRHRPTVLFEFAPQSLRNQGADPISLLNHFCSLGMTLSVVGMGHEFSSAEEIVRHTESGESFVEILAHNP